MKLLYNLREFFLPILEGKKPDENRYVLKAESIKLRLKDEKDPQKIESFFELCKDINTREKERLYTVESKAATLLGANGLIIAITINFGKQFLLAPQSATLRCLLYTIFVAILLYFSISIWYSIKTLQRKAYHVLRPKQIIEAIKNNSYSEYNKEIAATIIENTTRNYTVVNDKVDYMTMAQEYFKRAIFSSILFVLVSLLGSLFSSA